MEIVEIKKDLEKKLSPKRYKHTINVAETGKEYAKIYNMDEDKAYLSGLLHDCAKGLEQEYILEYEDDWIKFLEENDDIDIFNKNLLHGYIGVVVAKKKYDIHDIDILDAIKYHSTGSENMSNLAKIILIADKIEPSRKYPSISDIRKTCKKNLDDGLYLIINNTLDYLINNDEYISLNTIRLRNKLINIRGQYID